MASKEQLLNELLATMSNMTDAKPFVRACFYGDSGTGKTVLAMQIAQRLRSASGLILFVDSGQGFITLAVNERWRPLTANTVRMQYTNRTQLTTLANAIAANVTGSLNGMPINFGDIEVVVLDESTSMAYQDLVAVSKYRTAADPDRNEPNENTWPDRNISYNRYRETILELNALNCHIIHTGHTTQYNEKSTNIKLTAPSYGPGLYEKIIQDMHMVGHVTSSKEGGESSRQVRVQPTRTITAKSRLDGLGGEVSFDRIIEALGQFSEGKIREVEPILTEFVGIEVD